MSDLGKLTVEEFRDLIKQGKVVDPLIFLESIMSGQDPREFSELYKTIMEIDEFSDGQIDPSDWQEVISLVNTYLKYKPVSLSNSINASKTLAEYIHPKKKQIEMSGDLEGSSIRNSQLTEDEIRLFREKFNEQF